MARFTSDMQPVAIDYWKLDQIRHLKKGEFTAEQIADQVDLGLQIVREVLKLID